jgi:hypothetical protein
MRKTIITLMSAAAAAAVIGGTAMAAAATTTTPAPAGSQTITLKATVVSVKCIPLPGQKTSSEVPGDQCVFSANLTRNGAPYGHDAVHCVVVTTHDLICTAAWMLPAGQLAAAGDGGSTTGTRKLLPVLGGTSHYQGASGEVSITNTSSSTSTVVFHLLPASH